MCDSSWECSALSAPAAGQKHRRQGGGVNNIRGVSDCLNIRRNIATSKFALKKNTNCIEEKTNDYDKFRIFLPQRQDMNEKLKSSLEKVFSTT